MFEVFIGGTALASLFLILYNTRASRGFEAGLRRIVLAGRSGEAVFVEGRKLVPVVYVSRDRVRDEAGGLGERLTNLARSVRLDVTYVTSLFRVDRSRLLRDLEEEISRAQFGYSATRHVRYAERVRFLSNLYNEVARTHTPYAYQFALIVWVPEDDPSGRARAEAFKSMVEAEAGVRLEHAGSTIYDALVPTRDSPILTVNSSAPVPIAKSGEETGVIVGVDADGRLVIMDWPRDFETHVGVYGPTGRGKTVLLAGLAAQLGARSESRLDPFMVAVVDPKGDLSKLISPMATSTVSPARGDCIPVPRLEGVAEAIITPILDSYTSKSVRPCLGSLLRRGLVLFDLTRLPNEDRDIAASLIISSLALEASENVLPGRLVLIVDEAWRAAVADARHLVLALREGRSRGLHVVYATQSPDDLPRGVLTNTGSLIVFGGYTRSYTEAARMLGLDDARRLLSMPLGTAMIKLKDSPPLEVRILGFHEYVKREVIRLQESPERGVIRIGQEAKAAEGGKRIANVQEPGPHTPRPRQVPAALDGDDKG